MYVQRHNKNKGLGALQGNFQGVAKIRRKKSVESNDKYLTMLPVNSPTPFGGSKGLSWAPPPKKDIVISSFFVGKCKLQTTPLYCSFSDG